MSTKPFSQRYVLSETIKHMKADIALSMNKTIARLPEFVGDPAKNKEVLSTLASLRELDQMLDDIRKNNEDLIA